VEHCKSKHPFASLRYRHCVDVKRPRTIKTPLALLTHSVWLFSVCVFNDTAITRSGHRRTARAHAWLVYVSIERLFFRSCDAHLTPRFVLLHTWSSAAEHRSGRESTGGVALCVQFLCVACSARLDMRSVLLLIGLSVYEWQHRSKRLNPSLVLYWLSLVPLWTGTPGQVLNTHMVYIAFTACATAGGRKFK